MLIRVRWEFIFGWKLVECKLCDWEVENCPVVTSYKKKRDWVLFCVGITFSLLYVLCFPIISMFLRVLRASLNLQTLLLPRFYRRSLLLLDFNLLSKRKGIVTLKISTSRTDLASFRKRLLVRLRRVCFLIKNENNFLHRWNGNASTCHASVGVPCSCMFSAVLSFFFFFVGTIFRINFSKNILARNIFLFFL